MKRLLALFSIVLLSFFLFGIALTAYAQSPQAVKKTIAGVMPLAVSPYPIIIIDR